MGHLKVNGKPITDKKQTADLLASTVSNNNLPQHYSPKFQAFRMHSEREKEREREREREIPVKSTSDKSEEYNQPFSLSELKQALQKSNDSAVEHDDIHYKLLTNLPES